MSSNISYHISLYSQKKLKKKILGFIVCVRIYICHKEATLPQTADTAKSKSFSYST